MGVNSETIQLINTLSQTLTPAGLIVWGIWFLTRHFWPWWTGKRMDFEHEIQIKQLEASRAVGEGLKAQAIAIETLADCLKGLGKPLVIGEGSK